MSASILISLRNIAILELAPVAYTPNLYFGKRSQLMLNVTAFPFEREVTDDGRPMFPIVWVEVEALAYLDRAEPNHRRDGEHIENFLRTRAHGATNR